MGQNPILAGGTESRTSIYATTTNPAEHAIGTRGFLPDGRVFYWAYNSTGSTLDRGKLMVRPEIVADHTECAVAAGGGAAGRNIVSSITIGNTAMTENQYRDGFLVVTDGTGEGQMFKIRYHAAFSSAASTVAVTLYDNIVTALDATSTVSFIKNAYDTPQISATDQADIPTGVLPTSLPTLAYGWMQTWGEAAVWHDEAIGTVAQALTIGTGVAGQVEEDDTATTVSQEFIVGWNISLGVDTEYSPVMLTIRP